MLTIDVQLLLRAKDRDVGFGKADVSGLVVRIARDSAGSATYRNANGQRRRAGDQRQAAWCAVERSLSGEPFGIAVLYAPSNANHPPRWRLDEQGLLNPGFTRLGGWSLAAGQERGYRYRIVVYKGTSQADALGRQFEEFAAASAAMTTGGPPKK